MNTVQRPPVVELVGLPGSGKTTLEHGLKRPHLGRTEVPFWKTPLGLPALKVLWCALALAVETRPFAFTRIRRAFAVFLMLRCYRQRRVDLVVLDQGLVQKVWSLIVEARHVPQKRLSDLISACAAFGPVLLVFLKASPALAADRISKRPAGNSRFDGIPIGESEMAALKHGISVYNTLLSSWPAQTSSEIAADLPLEDKVMLLDTLIEKHLA